MNLQGFIGLWIGHVCVTKCLQVWTFGDGDERCVCVRHHM